MYNLYVAEDDFIDGRGKCPVPPTVDKVPLHQSVDFPLEVIFSSRSSKNLNDEVRLLEERVDQIRSSNEHKYWATNTPDKAEPSSVPNEIQHQTQSVDGGNGSVKSTP